MEVVIRPHALEQAKKMTEERFADSVRQRVAIYSTWYHKPLTSSGRARITLDGQEVVNLSTLDSGKIYQCVYHEASLTNCKTHPAVKPEERTPGQLVEKGEFSRYDLHTCCWEYLDLTIEAGLAHASPLINLLAILDQRLGKRRLVLLEPKGLHPLVQAFLAFRLEAEGLGTIPT